MTTIRLAALLAAALVLGGILGGSSVGAQDAASPVLDKPGQLSFEELGWTDDVLLTGDSPSATVRVRLPEGVRQGEPLWYGVRLVYELGNPGEHDFEGELFVGWNDRQFYTGRFGRRDDINKGFWWIAIERVHTPHDSGGGIELGEKIRLATSQFGLLWSLREGWNDVIVYLNFIPHDDKSVGQALIKKESQVIAVNWQPTDVQGEARTRIDDDGVRLDFRGRNLGRLAADFSIKAQVFREDGSHRAYDWPQGTLLTHSEVEFRETIAHEDDSPVNSIIMELDWGAGYRLLPAWPPEAGPSWYDRLPSPLRSGVGAMVALVVLWVGLPALWRQVRQARSGTGAETVDIAAPWLSPRAGWWLTAAALAAAAGIAALLWFTPWSGTGPEPLDFPVDSGMPEGPEFPRVTDADDDAVAAVAAAFLQSPEWAGVNASLEGYDADAHSLLTMNGHRVGVVARIEFESAVWVEQPLTVVRCGQTLPWEGEPFWLDGFQVWLMDGDEWPYRVKLSDYYGKLGSRDAHVTLPCDPLPEN